MKTRALLAGLVTLTFAACEDNGGLDLDAGAGGKGGSGGNGGSSGNGGSGGMEGRGGTSGSGGVGGSGGAGGSGTGGSGGSGGADGSGGAGGKGGSGGSGGSGGKGGSGGGGAAGCDLCAALEAEWVKAIPAAKTCCLTCGALQCVNKVKWSLACGCETYVNDTSALDGIKAAWQDTGCDKLVLTCIGCPDVACPIVTGGTCGDGTSKAIVAPGDGMCMDVTP